MTLRVVFFGSSGSVFTSRHFRALLETRHRIVGAVDVPPAYRISTNPLSADLLGMVEAARASGIPCFEPASPNSAEFVEAIHGLEPDVFIAAGYMLILKQAVLDIPRLIAVNFHASLLPYYRGKHPVFWALRNGEKWAGLTVHIMDPGIDTGDILYQVRVRTRRDDTVAALYDRIMDRSVSLPGRLLDDAMRGGNPRHPQPVVAGSYFSSATDADFHLDWSWPAEKLRRYIATTPGQCAIGLRGLWVLPLNAETTSCPAGVLPGTLIRMGRSVVTIAAGQGALASSRVRSEGGSMESFASLCRRAGFSVGEMLADH